MAIETYQRRTSSLFVTSLILFFVGLILFAALINGARDLVVLCVLVFAVMGGLRLWTLAASRRSEYAVSVNRTKIFAQESISLSVRIANRGILPTAFEVHVPLNSLSLPDGQGVAHGEGGLLWFQSADVTWEVDAKHRGVYTLGPTTVSAGDILGFYSGEMGRKEEREIVVYPKIVPLRPFEIPRRDFFGIPGGESPVDDPVYILGTIDYHYGRPAKYIHWKASARHHRLQQKVFEPTEQEKLLLVVDTDTFEIDDGDAFEETLEVVASLAAQLDRRGCAVGLLTNGKVNGASPSVPVTRNPFQMSAILETLARLLRESLSPMPEVMRKSSPPWGTTCLYFCRTRTQATDLARLRFAGRRLPLLVLAQRETHQWRVDCGVSTSSVNGRYVSSAQMVGV
jgi:uncharacterized protein (DUF58 family)